jgi:hypothetical protein
LSVSRFLQKRVEEKKKSEYKAMVEMITEKIPSGWTNIK